MVENSLQSPASVESVPRGDVRVGQDDILRSAFKNAAVVHAILFVFTYLMLDFGRSNQFCIVAMIGYWFGVLFILIRRRETPTKLDVWFIRYGVIPLWLTAPYVAILAYHIIGESTERGLDRLF